MKEALSQLYKARYIYMLLCIPFGLLAVFIYYPLIQGFLISLQDWNGTSDSEFIGFGNYLELFTKEPLFGKAILNIIFLSFTYVLQSIVVSFFLAWLIHHLRNQRSKYVLRIFVILPSLIPSMIVLLLWKKFYEPEGLVNRLLSIAGLEHLHHAWLGDVNVVLGAIAFVGTIGFPWMNGANTLIYLAGFLQLSKEMYESAKIDGSSGWSTFWKLEVPNLMGQTRIIMVLSMVFALQNYDSVFVLTQGGPMDASIVPGILLYKNAFFFGRYGYASAIGVFIFIFVFLLSLLSMRLSKQKEVGMG